MADDRTAGSGWLKGYRAFWFYNLARFALFGVLWLLLWLVGVPWLFAALIAAVVSAPLSWFLLATPREAFAATIESRVSQRRERTTDLGQRLDSAGNPDSAGTTDAGADLPPGVSESPGRDRSKRR